MEYMKKPAYRLVAFVALTVTISFISLKVFSGPDSVSKHLLSWTKPTAESSRGAYIYDSPKTIITRFQAIPDLEDLSGAGDHVWSTKLLTPHGGFLRVQYNDTFEQNWGISMFHGLHCLQLIRSNLVQANARLSDQAMAATHASHDHHGAHEQGGGIGTTGTNDHLGHCFAYIAQVCSDLSYRGVYFIRLCYRHPGHGECCGMSAISNDIVPDLIALIVPHLCQRWHNRAAMGGPG